MGDVDRKRLGAWYTPERLVEFVLDRATDGLGVAAVTTVLDPSCGDGRFLQSATRRWPEASIAGIDIDPSAIASSVDSVPNAQVVLADALDYSGFVDGTFDLVVGNPPFLGQMASATTRGGRSRLGGGAYADTAALFVARALQLAKPDGGRVAFVLPQSFLAARDVAPIRAAIAEAGRVVSLWAADALMFDASVHTIVLVVERGRSQGPIDRWFGPTFQRRPSAVLPSGSTWSALVADLFGVPSVSLETESVIGDRAVATADFRDQYYGLVGSIVEASSTTRDRPRLVTSGLIDVGRCSWGERSVRFAKQRFDRPVVELANLDASMTSWIARRLVPKVLVATQTRVLEACADARGEFVPSVPVISVIPTDVADVWSLTAVLCSPPVAAWAASRSFGAGLQPDAIKLSATQVGTIPLPTKGLHGAEVEQAIEYLRNADLNAFAQTMCAAYVTDPDELVAWWLPRTKPSRRS
jgi:methylase of polypeptide subunit release factors